MLKNATKSDKKGKNGDNMTKTYKNRKSFYKKR